MEETRPVGRPTDYTQELADKLCAEIAMGYSVRTICSKEGHFLDG